MKRILAMLMLITVVLLAFSGCDSHEHEWDEGKCTVCSEEDTVESIDVTYTGDANPLYGINKQDFEIEVTYTHGSTETLDWLSSSRFELSAPEELVPGKSNTVTITLNSGESKSIDIDVPPIRYYELDKEEFAAEFVKNAATFTDNYYSTEYSYGSDGTIDKVCFIRDGFYEAFLVFEDPSASYADTSKVLSVNLTVNGRYSASAFDQLKMAFTSMTTPPGGLTPLSVHNFITMENCNGDCISRGDEFSVEYTAYRGGGLSGSGEMHYVRAKIVQGTGDGSD